MDRAGKKVLRASLVVAGVVAAVFAVIAAVLAIYVAVIYPAIAIFSLPVLALVLFAVALVMLRTGKKSLPADTSVDDRLTKYVVIAAVIAAALCLMGHFVSPVKVLAGLALAVTAVLLLPVALVLDIAGKKFPRASLVIAAVSAVVFYVVDAFEIFLAPYALLLFAVVLLYFLPAALWALRTDYRVARFRAAKAAIYCIAAVSIVLTIDLQNRMADRRAVKLGDACLAYRAKYHHYPQDLKALVPEFIASVPAPRYSLAGDFFTYFAGEDQRVEPMFYYELFPPFGRRFYHMETRTWGFLD